MYDSTTGRWTTVDPIGFRAGDLNLYRYVGNDPTNATDPTGLWTWRLDERGRVMAVAEPGDTLGTLARDFPGILDAAALDGFGESTTVTPGAEIDVTRFFPAFVVELLRRQQNTKLESIRDVLERAKLTDLAEKPGTIGSAQIDLMRRTVFGDDGRVKQEALKSGAAFGSGNCFGFVGLWLGKVSPAPVPEREYGMAGLDSEPVIAGKGHKPGINQVGTATEPRVVEVPKEGLLAFLKQGRKPVTDPRFGALALFETSKKEIRHAGIVLGRSRRGKVYILQKLNPGSPYAISTVDHPYFEWEGDPLVTYYQK